MAKREGKAGESMVDMRVVKLQAKIWMQSPDRSRCYYCGKRMKFVRGGLIGFGGREDFCRACGREQPPLSEIVDLSPEEWALIESFNPDSFPDLPECLQCGVKLQVSRDGTKVFCMSCTREWERFEFEDILGRAIPFEWLGRIPLEFDTSKRATTLQERLDAEGIDSSTPYLVVHNVATQTRDDLEGGKFKKWMNSPETYIACYADYFAQYVMWPDGIVAEEHAYSETLPEDDLSSFVAPFAITLGGKDKRKFDEMMTYLLNSYVLNKNPYQPPELFGTAARDAALNSQAASAEPSETLAAQLGQLFELHKLGALSDEEYAAAKAKLLG